MEKEKNEETKHKHIIIVNSSGKILTYTADNLDDKDPIFLKFVDKFGNVICLNKSVVISMQEIGD